MEQQEQPFYIAEHGNQSSVYISSNIEQPSSYYPLYDFFRTREPHQQVDLYLNCYGGRLDTAIQIIMSMMESQAMIIGHIEHECASAATMLFLACDSWSVSPFSKAFLHADSGGYIGKRNEVVANFEFERVWLDNFNYELYQPFLTQKEVKEMLEGKDFYFNAEEISERLEKVIKEREKVQKKMMKEMVG